MKLVGLPGRNPETAGWMQTLIDSLALGQTSTEVARYRHWEEDGNPDVAHEAAQLNVAPDDVVVAKSMGTMVLLTSGRSGSLPARAVFIGTPIRSYPAPMLEDLREIANKVPSLFIQQTSDFTGGFEAVKSVVGEAACASLAEVAGEDHVYADRAELKAIIEAWWS